MWKRKEKRKGGKRKERRRKEKEGKGGGLRDPLKKDLTLFFYRKNFREED
jgi:hypothetical protein